MLMTFTKVEEAVYFCKQLQLHKDCYHYVKKQQRRRRFLLQMTEDISYDQIVYSLQSVFHQFRLHQVIHSLVYEVYFYEKYDEIKTIFNYTVERLSDEPLMKKVFSENENFDHIVFNLLKREVCSKEELSFDTTIDIVLEEVRPFLINIIGLAIEEWKRDLRYDYFLHSVKQFINWQPLKTNILHIIQENNFVYFKENGEKYDDEELFKEINNSLIYAVGLSEIEWNLSPIIALAPKFIYIYGDDQLDAKTLTIKEIFQDRMQFLPIQLFPFYKVK